MDAWIEGREGEDVTCRIGHACHKCNLAVEVDGVATRYLVRLCDVHEPMLSPAIHEPMLSPANQSAQ